jgi:tetratricopeptide (TPR) repeat protein
LILGIRKLLHQSDQAEWQPTPSSPTSALKRPVSPERKRGAFAEGMQLANRLLVQNKPAEAVEILKEIVQRNPEDEDVRYNLGIALSRLGQNEEAAKEYREALRIFPDYAEAHNNLGNLLLQMGDREEATKHLEAAVKITPEYAIGWNNLGKSLREIGRTNEAREAFAKAVKFDTNYWQAHFNLGVSYLEVERLPDAQAEFNIVQHLQPDFAPAKTALERITAVLSQ